LVEHKWVPWVRWKTFRGFEDTGRNELRPLTVLLGANSSANSSGKRSAYKPLSLMQQTVQSRRVFRVAAPTAGAAVVAVHVLEAKAS
jgi:predicted ATPase